ncbi:hypothetical protein ACFQI7_32790 [Paenibacillus allorhizosphaerae]|uniref:hypothetical protein n=1 Tax=Paenibacillus allorhizosphaerae TaxID=2849866 RepID=UPI001C4076DE|nr:hypothetical protein [Paenibacillus allorhizosphaerae]
MTFNQASYKMNRDETFRLYNSYLDSIQNKNTKESELVKARVEILNLYYYELLILQSSITHWETLLSDPDLNFRRKLCLKLYNLKQVDVEAFLDLSDGAVSNLFNKSSMPVWPRPFQLSVLFNHPWQLINNLDPDPNSYRESPEYFHAGVSERIHLQSLSEERSKVKTVRGYVITDSQELFPGESGPVTGRWVTTYPEFDYFEFHLNYEPMVHKGLREAILHYFPAAKHLITTYRPFKPLNKRSVWAIIPKNEVLPSYLGMVHELKEYRENTEYHSLK